MLLNNISPICIAQKKGRIVGGEWADYGQFPYQAGIYGNERAIFCGGSLITPDRVLTAGQCASGYANYKQTKVRKTNRVEKHFYFT